MDRPPYLILLLVAVVGGIVLIWGIYTKLTAPPAPAASTQPSTQPTLLERMQERLAATRAAAATQTTTQVTTRPASD